jgi:hypothetical protein
MNRTSNSLTELYELGVITKQQLLIAQGHSVSPICEECGTDHNDIWATQ